MPESTSSLRPAPLNTLRYFFYPFTYVLPSGDLLIWSNTYGEIVQPLTGRTVDVVPRWSELNTRIMTAYPFGGSSVLLALDPATDYRAEVVVFGGQWCDGWINTTGVDLSLRLAITRVSGWAMTFCGARRRRRRASS